MIDKAPKITVDKDKKATSDRIAQEYVERIRKILRGELKHSDFMEEEKNKAFPEPPEFDEGKNKTKSVDNSTWHDKYYGNKDDAD